MTKLKMIGLLQKNILFALFFKFDYYYFWIHANVLHGGVDGFLSLKLSSDFFDIWILCYDSFIYSLQELIRGGSSTG